MNIHEYQAKEVLRKFGVATLKGQVAHSPDEAVAAAKLIGGSLWVVKAQIHAGGRGKGGGVKLAKSLEEVVIKTPAPSQQKIESKELQKLKRSFEKIEADIASLNQKKTSVELELSNPDIYTQANKFSELESSYKKVQEELTSCNKQYEELFEKIMELES